MDNDQLKTTGADSVPTFTPPSDNGNGDAIPTFTPPTPTFTPPQETKPSFNGPACYYHKDEPAVAQCAVCGRYICQDCFDSYGVTSGEYAGQALCYDCTKDMVADNVATLTANKNKIKFQFILSLVGIGIGLILGLIVGAQSAGFSGALIFGLVFAAVGGVFLSFLKTFASVSWNVIKISFSSMFDGSGIGGIIGGFLGGTFRILLEAIKCIYYTISNTIYYISYIKRTSGFIESDQTALRQMEDYMEYTMVRNQNRGIDIETLLKENSSLANNSVAQMARNQSEEQIEANMRNCVASINENGEIIRNFNISGRSAA